MISGNTDDFARTSSSTYTIPGPDPFTCGASGGGSAQTSTTAKPTTSSTTLATSTKTSSASSTTSSAASGGACVAKYGQCGGTGWTGATCCVSGSTCSATNQYYSQCL